MQVAEDIFSIFIPPNFHFYTCLILNFEPFSMKVAYLYN